MTGGPVPKQAEKGLGPDGVAELVATYAAWPSQRELWTLGT
jgi:hypothetical protein